MLEMFQRGDQKLKEKIGIKEGTGERSKKVLMLSIKIEEMLWS